MDLELSIASSNIIFGANKMDKEFKVKTIDQEGLETLEVVADADKFNAWMYHTILPFSKGNIL